MKPETKLVLHKITDKALWVLTLVLVGYLLYRFSGVFYPSTRTDDLTKAKAVLYSTKSCPFCLEARYYFAQNKVPYFEYNINESDEGYQKFTALDGQGVPLIIIGTHRIQGMRRGKLREALSQ